MASIILQAGRGETDQKKKKDTIQFKCWGVVSLKASPTL